MSTIKLTGILLIVLGTIMIGYGVYNDLHYKLHRHNAKALELIK